VRNKRLFAGVALAVIALVACVSLVSPKSDFAMYQTVSALREINRLGAPYGICNEVIVYKSGNLFITRSVDPRAFGTSNYFVGGSHLHVDAVTGASPPYPPQHVIDRIYDLSIQLQRWEAVATHFAGGETEGWGGWCDSWAYL